MGRHSSRSPWSYYRSIIGWFLPWALISVILLVGVWTAVNALGGDEAKAPISAESPSPDEEDPTPEVTDEPSEEPSEKPSKSPKPDPKPTKTREPEDKPEDDLITAGMTVQVLNGTSNPDADDLMADRLAGLGFEVIAIDGSSKAYPATTVFWSYAGSQEAAERLAARFGWIASPKPENLSTEVALHVVAGDDSL